MQPSTLYDLRHPFNPVCMYMYVQPKTLSGARAQALVSRTVQCTALTIGCCKLAGPVVSAVGPAALDWQHHSQRGPAHAAAAAGEVLAGFEDAWCAELPMYSRCWASCCVLQLLLCCCCQHSMLVLLQETARAWIADAVELLSRGSIALSTRSSLCALCAGLCWRTFAASTLQESPLVCCSEP